MAEAGALRIALITSSFAPHFGGVEEHVAQVARQLHARGHVVEVWTVDRGARPTEPFVGGDGVEITVRYLRTPLPARSITAMARFAARWPSAWRSWRRAYRRLRPDLLHVHCFGPNGVYAGALHRRYGAPLMITSHGETIGDDGNVYARSKFLRARLRESLASAQAVTAPSRFVLDELGVSYGLTGGEVVPNGVDLDIGPGDPAPCDGPYLFAVGRLGAMKGFDLLIDAFARLGADGMKLLVGGEGPERAALERRAQDAGVADHVLLLGRISPEQVDAHMRAAVAVVVPSRSEAFGIVALEAWRAGAPLVMTSRGGGGEFVEDGVSGLLVDPTDADALTAALRRVTADEDLRSSLAAQGRARVGEFTWRRVAESYERRYRQLSRPTGS